MQAYGHLEDQMFMVIVNDRKYAEELQQSIKAESSEEIRNKIYSLKKRLTAKNEVGFTARNVHAYNLAYIMAEHWDMVEYLPPKIREYVEKNYNLDGSRSFHSNKTPENQEVQTQTKEETTMKLVTEIKHYVNGKNIEDMSDNEIITQISKAEQRIEELSAIKVESKAIKKEIANIQKFIKDVVVLLDKRK